MFVCIQTPRVLVNSSFWFSFSGVKSEMLLFFSHSLALQHLFIETTSLIGVVITYVSRSLRKKTTTSVDWVTHRNPDLVNSQNQKDSSPFPTRSTMNIWSLGVWSRKQGYCKQEGNMGHRLGMGASMGMEDSEGWNTALGGSDRWSRKRKWILGKNA